MTDEVIDINRSARVSADQLMDLQRTQCIRANKEIDKLLAIVDSKRGLHTHSWFRKKRNDLLVYLLERDIWDSFEFNWGVHHLSLDFATFQTFIELEKHVRQFNKKPLTPSMSRGIELYIDKQIGNDDVSKEQLARMAIHGVKFALTKDNDERDVLTTRTMMFIGVFCRAYINASNQNFNDSKDLWIRMRRELTAEIELGSNKTDKERSKMFTRTMEQYLVPE